MNLKTNGGPMPLIKLLIIFLLLSGIANAQNADHITIAKKISIKSSVLGEERTILVSTPADYDHSKGAYPVWYVLDGDKAVIHYTSGLITDLAKRDLCPEMIVVAIANTKRFRDMTPTRYKENPKVDSGGADKFLKFIEKELFPYIQTNYRTLPYRIFAGHSASGMCVAHAFLSHNKMFNGYIALSPCFWWDSNLFVKTAEEKIDRMDLKHRHFYFSTGTLEVPKYVDSAQAFFITLTEKAPSELKWKFDFLKDEDHGSQGTIAMYNGLRFIYQDWKFDSNKVRDGGLKYINSFYLNKSKKYGYEILPSEAEMISFGYMMVRSNKFDEAIKIFKKNILRHPQSANAYDSLAEAYLAAGKVDLSIKNYEKAVKLGTSQNDEQLELYKQGLLGARARKK